MQNPIIKLILLWGQEFFVRLSKKKPKFFKVLGVISTALVSISFIPGAVEEITGFTLPENIVVWINWIDAKIFATAAFVSLLTNKQNTVGVTEEGTVVKETNKKLAFTNAAEIKSATKKDKPVVEVVEPKTEQKIL